MIKIQINNLPQKKQEYLDAILDSVAFRISVLRKCLLHLNANPIDFNDINYQSIGPVTQKIIRIIGGGNTSFDDAADYVNKVTNYLNNPVGLNNINIVDITQFCDAMLANNNQQLSQLLVCEAADLTTLNQTIINFHNLNANRNLAVIKLAFDYSYANIATEIKRFFRINQFVSACPYCNKEETVHHTNDAGEVAESFQLDHFYDKASYPLLAYTFFNLVPSDQNCNVTNKLTTEFTETYHLNPHEGGFDNRIKFVPIGLTPSFDVSKIEVEILEAQGSVLYVKMNGNNQPNEEQDDLGNLNVFKIRSRYKKEKLKAGQILELVKANDKNIKHIKKFLQSLNGLNKELTYIDWYKKKINGSYYPETFNDNSYSKFSRDLHDYYYSVNGTRFNRYITDLNNHH